MEIRAENAGDVVNLALVVVRLHRLNWYVVRVPCTAEVNTTGYDDKEADNANKHVEDGVERWDQRRSNEAAVDGPVKGDGHEAIPVHPAKELVDDGAVGPNPAEKAKVREAFENPTREPVPDKCGEADDTEEPVAADGPAVGSRGVGWRVVVQAVEHGAVDEVGRPDHGSWPDQEATGETGKAISGAERSDAKEELESPAKGLVVEEALGQENISSIQRTTTICGLSVLVSLHSEENKSPRAEPLTLDMATMTTCSLKLNLPGRRLNLMPKTFQTLSGMMRSQPRPMG